MSDAVMVTEYGVRWGTDAERLAAMKNFSQWSAHCLPPTIMTPEIKTKMEKLVADTQRGQELKALRDAAINAAINSP
jgi:hypothetical protein